MGLHDGPQNLKVGRVTLTTYLGVVCHPQANTSYAYLCTKFEDCSFSRSKDMKEDPKHKNRADFGWLGSLKFILPMKAREYVFTVVGLCVCLYVCVSVCDHAN